MNYWLLLEKSEETRISKGIDGYQDQTGESYLYDNLVPNYKNLTEGDFVVLRKENEIVGIGAIGNIVEKPDTKIHRRCPKCNSTDIRARATKLPKWKCGKCALEFSGPKETLVEVRAFIAAITGFTRLNAPPSVRNVKLCAATGDGSVSQLSMLRLNPVKIQTLFESIDPSPSSRSSTAGSKGQGFGLSQAERKAVELRAMKVARALYESDGWTVIDKSSSQPFDLFATKDSRNCFIEVKGTKGEGCSVILTHGEVAHVRIHHHNSALVVVSGIVLEGQNDDCRASGGVVTTHEDPWNIIDTDLTPTQYRYNVK